MKINLGRTPASPGFTLSEVMISMAIGVTAIGLSLGVLLTGLRVMYKDTQRLTTNANLRKFTAEVAKETVDATEFYVFPTYEKLDGSVNLTTDIAPLETDAYGTDVAYGDCLVLVARVTVDNTSNIRQFRIYYRVVTDFDQAGPIRYYESTDYGTSGTSSSLATLLNAINLNATPTYPGTRVLAATARGRGSYPIFSTPSSITTSTNESVSINVEIINGSSVNNVLSSSSFNYTISPRR